MKRLGEFVVKYRKVIIIVYLVILVPSIIGYLMTGINYDTLAYMPDDLNSKKGELLLEDQFEHSGMGLLMVRGKSIWEINKLIDTIKPVEGVDKIVWLGDYTDIYVPLKFVEPEIKERFVSGDTVLLQIQFDENPRSEKTNHAVAQINKLIGDDDDILFGGEPAILSEMQATIDEEIMDYAIVAVIMIIIILTMASSSYLNPLLFLISVGVAVIINMGTNIFQGEISFITASIAAVMQLGISLDYSIFLMHRFEEEKNKHETIEQAMAATINKTAVAIASSALTTIGGFAALLIMQNGIGQDLGMVLGKGILISLIVNLTFLPCLILGVYRFSSRYQHRILLPSFKSTARWIPKLRWAFLALFFIILVPSFLAQSKVEYYYSNLNFLPAKSNAVNATNEIMDEYGAADVAYVITTDDGRVREHQLVAVIKQLPAVESVVAISEQIDLAIPELMVPPEVFEEFQEGDYRYFLAFLNTFEDERQSFEAIDQIREAAGSFHEQYYVTGPSAMTRDLASLVDTDAKNVAIFSIAAICLIIAISFKSLSLPFIMILAIQLAIWANLSILYYQGQSVSSMTPMIISAIQLGATVDYAILFTMRYKENIFRFNRRIDAVRQTIEDAGRPILTSALTLFSATFVISFIAGIKTTGEMTMLIGRGAIVSMLVIFTVLPALLLLFEKLIRHTTRGWAQAPINRPAGADCNHNKGGIPNEQTTQTADLS